MNDPEIEYQNNFQIPKKVNVVNCSYIDKNNSESFKFNTISTSSKFKK